MVAQPDPLIACSPVLPCPGCTYFPPEVSFGFISFILIFRIPLLESKVILSLDRYQHNETYLKFPGCDKTKMV